MIDLMYVYYVRLCVEKAEVCLFQGVTVLGPGQSLVQYFEGELCYTVHCLHHRDTDTGFYAMEITSVNCTQKCASVCIQDILIVRRTYVISLNIAFTPPHLLLVLSIFSTRYMYSPQILRCAAAPVKMSLALSPVKMELQSFSL